MNKKSLFLLPVVAILLGGCVGTKHYDAKEYCVDVKWERDTFRVLQLSDIHFSQCDYFDEHFDVMQDTINKANPDLIVVNGDAFTFATKATVKTLFKWLDTRKNKNLNPIYWTFVFGNHDDQGQYADTWIPKLLAGEVKGVNYKHCVFKNLADDDVTGRSNFVLNLVKNKSVKYQIYLFDSNSYNSQRFEGIYKGEGKNYYYDYIKLDQIEWYNRMIEYTKQTYGNINSSAYFHIPLPQFQAVLNEEEGTKIYSGDNAEGLVSGPQIDTGLYAAIKEGGLTHSVSAAHDHVNNFVGEIENDSIYLTYGTHATNRIYFAKDKIGGQVLEIPENGIISASSFINIYAENNYEGGR